jgi:hypothetical protein
MPASDHAVAAAVFESNTSAKDAAQFGGATLQRLSPALEDDAARSEHPAASL